MQTDNSKAKLCIIAGPTAIGKTDISISIANKLNGEIISADSAQVYKYMDIGTAKIKLHEMKGINHYMIDEVYPDEEFNVAQFNKRATKYIKAITGKNKLPIIAGGTGLYINSLLNNLDFTPIVTDEIFRKEMQELAQKKGNEYLHNLLLDIDPQSYKRLHPNDIRRVIRALEVHKHTGKTITYFQEESKKIPDKFDYVYIGLKMDRVNLYDRINKRVDIMIEKGLIKEVKCLLQMGYSSDLVSMQALGYKEIIGYLHGEYSLDDAVTLLKRDSRRYAKRQLSWFRSDKRVKWVDLDNYSNKSEAIKNIIHEMQEKLF